MLKRLLVLLILSMVLPVMAQSLDTEELDFLLEDYVSEDDAAVVLFVVLTAVVDACAHSDRVITFGG